MTATLLRAGLMVMARKGIAATSVDDIVKEAEVARGSFYKYFDSPASLANAVGVAVAEEMILGFEEGTDDGINAIGDPAERLGAGIAGVLEIVGEYPVFGRFLVRAGWPSDRTGRLVLEKIGGTLEEGVTAGRFINLPLPVAMALVGGVVIGCVHEISEGTEPQTIVNAAVSVVLRGLGLPSRDVLAVTEKLPATIGWRPGPLMKTFAAPSATPAGHQP